jgi:hypothetical protein
VIYITNVVLHLVYINNISSYVGCDVGCIIYAYVVVECGGFYGI